MKIVKLITFTTLTFFFTACSWSNIPFLYKPTIQQGNILPEDRINTVKIGMNRDEVNYLLGNPVLVNVIDTQETQYIYTLQSGKKPIIEKKVILTFVADRLVKIAS